MFWTLQIGAWLFIAVLGMLARTLTLADLKAAFVLTLTLESLGFLLTSLVHLLFLARLKKIISMPVILFMACFCLAVGTSETYAAWYLRELFFPNAHPIIDPVSPAIFYIAVLLGWSLAYFSLRSEYEARVERLRRSEAQTEAMRSELEQLRLQLAPHFLFNALNSVASEIHERPDSALEMVRGIAGYLRYCLNQANRSLCPLVDEIEAMQAYLRIQELRFEDRLKCTVKAQPEALNTQVPHMILQGLVENAVKHGLKLASASIEIAVFVKRTGTDTITISVSNSGKLSAQDPNRQAIGLSNLKRRLNLHYGDAYSFSLVEQPGTVVATIVLKGQACCV
ncbi:Histidine kinase [Roseibium suaedae]|uniref:Histidine kinase n=2 Tax=Roseibium suaedae TaxID=735517 RepID=A0A1M7NKN4_9HYPH|nr:Histidine kinase [Roseibium suaedae]